ncbi:MAG: FecR family protein, partial [bacterium]
GGPTVQGVIGVVVSGGDVVQTARESKATILFKDGSVLRLGPSTSIEIEKLDYRPDKGVANSAYGLAKGTIMFAVGSIFGNDDSSYEVKTPTSVSGVRGTIGIIRVGTDPRTGEPATMSVSVEDEVVVRGTSGGSHVLVAGQYSMIGQDGVAGAPQEISEKDLAWLISLVTPQSTCMEERAKDLRESTSGMLPVGTDGTAADPDSLLLYDEDGSSGSGGDTDGTSPEDSMNQDNPSDMVYQEPPQATELTIEIEIPM